MTPQAAQPGPPDPQAVYRMVGELVRFLKPGATDCRIVVGVPLVSGRLVEDTISVPLVMPTADPAGLDLATRMLTSLGKLMPGQWMGGKALAAETDADPDSGHFKRTIGELRDAGKVESSKNHGYRLKLTPPPADPD